MTTHEGYLLKEGAGMVKSFKKRWFQMKSGELSYFKAPGEKEATGTISLAQTKVKDNGDKSFTISGPSLPRAYNLAVENIGEKEPWIKALTAGAAEAAGGGVEAAGGGESTLLSSSGKDVGLKDFDVLKVIGRGSFGKVMKVKFKGTGEIYAMKALRKDVLMQENMVQNAKDEKQILQTIRHPFVVGLHFAFQTKDRLYLVLDLLPGGELFFHLKQEGVFSEKRAKQYSAEIASALTHLHGQGIIYRDLKPENVVLDAKGHACLTDMGLAKTKMNANQQTYTFCGTPEYIAPEILKGTGHNKGVDWWALGILIFEMLSGLPPFYNENVNEMYELILNAPLEFPDEVPPAAQDLIKQLLEREPSKRLTEGEKIMQHAWFKDIDFVKLAKKELIPEFIPDMTGDEDKYVEDEFKEQSTKNSLYNSTAKAGNDSDFAGFNFSDKK